MAKFKCVCGHVIPITGPIPNPDELLFIRPEDYWAGEDTVERSSLYGRMRYMYLCPVSGHLYVAWDNTSRQLQAFAPIEGHVDRIAGERLDSEG